MAVYSNKPRNMNRRNLLHKITQETIASKAIKNTATYKEGPNSIISAITTVDRTRVIGLTSCPKNGLEYYYTGSTAESRMSVTE